MPTTEELELLIKAPRESLTVELKRSLDLSQAAGQGKLIKALFALRNSNGGYLIVGFDNSTMQPTSETQIDNNEVSFHPDHIQSLISKYASEPFEVAVHFVERRNRTHPVLVVPGGVRTPVVVKADLPDETNRNVICTHDVFCRSLHSNGTVSSTKATWKDWPQIVQICFDNRETDIGNFLRRHLRADALSNLSAVLSRMTSEHKESPPRQQAINQFLAESKTRCEAALASRSLPECGYWDGALSISGLPTVPATRRQWLRELDRHNPRYTGWPIWMNTENTFIDAAALPQLHDGVFEETIVSLPNAHVDFYRFDPKGFFYLRRAYQDDLVEERMNIKPFSVLDFALPILRVVEAIAVGMAFAKSMGCEPERTLLSFAFRWESLKGRSLVSWADPNAWIVATPADRVQEYSFIEICLDTPLSRLGAIAKELTTPLMNAFDADISDDTCDRLANKLINRTL